MQPIRHLIWDFDGTLHDTYPAIARAVNQALARFGRTATLARIIDLASVSLTWCVAELAEEHGIDPAALAAAFAETYARVEPAAQGPFPGTRAICQHILDRGGANVIVTHRRTASLEHLLAIHDMRRYFRDIVAGDAGFPKKPDPAAFRHLIARHGLVAEEVLVIGDRDLDIRAAQRAGLRSCWFRGAGAAVQPTYVVHDYADLYGLLVGGELATDRR